MSLLAASKKSVMIPESSHLTMSRYTAVRPENFGGIPEEHSSYETSRAVIFPVPLESGTSHCPGARNGPAAILAASRNLELYDEELHVEPYKEIGIHTLPAIDTVNGSLDDVVTELFSAGCALAEDGKFTVALGGEHSLTPPLISVLSQKYKNISVLHIGAHAELGKECPGSPVSSRCAMRRVTEICHAVQVGVRSISAEDADDLQDLPTKIYWARDIARVPLKSWIADVLSNISASVYVTASVSAFDPSIVPATSRPEPGGLDWYQVTSLLRALAGHKKIVGLDVVDLVPQAGHHASDALVAKLVYKCLGYVFCQG
jgi:agmatinase